MPKAIKRYRIINYFFSFFLFAVLTANQSAAQDSSVARLDTANSISQSASPKIPGPNKQRVWFVGGTHAVIWVGSFIALSQAWYSDYGWTSFHFFNDWDEWMQMDKMGHFWTAYHLSRLSTDSWRWAGINNKKAIWLGGISAVAYQSIIEIQDGFSEKWGFSWGDMAMNVAGAGSYIAQEFGWKEQRITIKLSYWPYDYPPDLQPRADDLFGTNTFGKVLKDYNSQTYWLNFNLRSFFPQSKIPRWLNLSVGHSAELMLGGTENKWTDENGEEIDRTDIPRFRRFFLSVDVDLTKIRTKSKFLKTVFSVANMVKIPAPALEFSQGKFKGHWLYY